MASSGEKPKRQRKPSLPDLEDRQIRKAIERAIATKPTLTIHVPFDLVPAGAYLFSSVIDGICAAAIQTTVTLDSTPGTVEKWVTRTTNLRMALEGVANISSNEPALRYVSDEAVIALARLNRAVADVYWSPGRQRQYRPVFVALRATGSMEAQIKVNLSVPDIVQAISNIADPTSRRKTKEDLRHLEEMNRGQECKQQQEIAERDIEISEKYDEFASKRLKRFVEHLKEMESLGAMTGAEVVHAIREAVGLNSAAIDSAEAIKMSVTRSNRHQLPPGNS